MPSPIPVFYSIFLYVVALEGFMSTQLGLGTMRRWEVGMQGSSTPEFSVRLVESQRQRHGRRRRS